MSANAARDSSNAHLQVHIICSPEDFPVEIQSLTQSLRHLEKDVMEVIPHPGSSLEKAIKAAHACSARAQRIILDGTSYNNIKPEPTTQAVGLAPGYILEQCNPELQFYPQCEYSRGVYPCWRGNSSSRLLPFFGSAISAVTMPFYLGDGNPNTRGDGDTACSYVPQAFDPLLQAHHLRTNYGHNTIPFPVLFVALADEIYKLLASALLHRHALRVHTPCLAFLHDPLNCQLRAMWAWSAPHKDHECLEVHVAHAPWSITASHELGVFDIQDKGSATGLAMYLHSISTPLYMDVMHVKDEVPNISNNLMKDAATFWRVDQNQFFHKQDNETEKIVRWLRDMDALSESLSSGPSSWPQQDEHGDEDEVASSTTTETDSTRLAVAKNSLAWADHYVEEWRLSNPSIVFANLAQFSAEQSEYYRGRDLDPDMALSCGIRAMKCYFPPPEFPDMDTTPEPLKTSLEYIRCALPPSVHFPLTQMSQVTLPVLPQETVPDNEGDIEIPFDLSAPEDIEAFLNFRAAAQVENWIRISLNMAPMSPLDPAMTTYLMRNISTFLKVSELAKQANIMAGPSEAFYREIFDLIFGAHGDVDKVYKCFGQEIFTARQRYFDEQYTLADENLPPDTIFPVSEYPRPYKLVESVKSLRESISFDQLTTPLGVAASKCFDSIEGTFIKRSCNMTTKGIGGFLDFQDHWGIQDNGKVLSAAALQAVTLNVSACDGILYTALPIEMGVDDLETISLFQKASQATGSSTATAPSRQRELPKPFRNSLDALIDEVVPPTATRKDFRGQLGLSDNGPIRNQRQHLSKLPALCLPLAFLEINQRDADPEQGALQTNNLVMACRFLISLGIYEFPLYALSTFGSRVRLLCAWATIPTLSVAMTFLRLFEPDKIQSRIYLTDENCPEWDISKPRDAIRLCLFLQHLRTTHRDQLEKKFDEVKKDVSDSWKQKDSWTPRERALREWKMSQQKEGVEYKEWMKKVMEAWPEFSSLQVQVAQALGAVDEAKAVLGNDDDDDDRWAQWSTKR